jgi:ankyrin repeat protein
MLSHLYDESKEEITDNIRTRFLLAQLLMDSFRDKLIIRDVKFALQKLPQGSDAYDVAYSAAMERIFAQGGGSSKMAKKILAWILCAHRPLSTLELLHALAVEPGDNEIDEDNILETEQLLTICAGLVTIDEQSDNVRFVHYTTQEYLQRNQQMWLLHAEFEIARSCTAYLSIDGLTVGPCPSQEDYEHRLEEFALLGYAAVYWGQHLHQLMKISFVYLSDEIFAEALSLLLDTNRVSAMSQVLFMSERSICSRVAVREEGQGFSGIHWTGKFGLLPLLEQWIHKRYEMDQRDLSGRTPLSWAAENGHEATAKLLLDTGKVDINSKDKYGRTPLSWAAANGEEVTLKQLLDTGKVDVDSKDNYGQIPLTWAAKNGHRTIAMSLIEKTSTHDLAEAARVADKNEAVELTFIQRLPDCGPDVFGRTPYMWAALGGHISLIQSHWPSYFPTSCSALAKKDNLRLSLIHFFAIGNCAEGVGLILDVGSNVNDTDSQAWTPLHWAAYFGHGDVADVLLRRNADTSPVDSKGWTPYELSIFVGDSVMAQSLKDSAKALCSIDFQKAQPLRGQCDACGRVSHAQILCTQHTY